MTQTFVPQSTHKIISWTTIGLVVVALLLSSFYTIDAGERGVILRFGKITKVADEGLNIKLPFIDEVNKMSIRDRNLTLAVEASSSDIQSIAVDVALVYSLNESEVAHIYQTYRNDIEGILITPTLSEKINAIIAEYPIESFIEKRAEISNKISTAFTSQVKGAGITVKSLLITNHDFSDEFNKAIEAKKVAEQNALRAKFTLEQKRLEAEAQKIKQASLSPMVLQEMAINKWDGKLPDYFSGEQLPFLSIK